MKPLALLMFILSGNAAIAQSSAKFVMELKPDSTIEKISIPFAAKGMQKEIFK